MLKLSRTAITAVALSLAAGAATGQQIERHPIPGSDFPISEAVMIPPEASVVYLSGKVPQVQNADAADDSVEAFGDTEAQTVSVLEGIQAALERRGLTMGDVVKMTGFLVADPEMGAMDFSGFMDGYTQFFATDEQPNTPARSVVEVAALANPGWLVEIEVIAATVD